MKKQLLILMLLLSTAINAFAVEVEIGGLWYDVNTETKEAAVIQFKDSKYVGDIVIPESVEYNGVTCSVTSIGDSTFYNCSYMYSLTIPSNMRSIGEKAFWWCERLKKVIVKDISAWCSVEFVDHWSNPLVYAHHLYSDENTEITELAIPNSVTSIGEMAFSYCQSLTSVTIPNSVMSIGRGAFHFCSGLTSITIPNSVTSIGGNAFSYCSGLTSITIPNSVTSIGGNAFNDCSGLTSITIPNSVTSIESWVFNDCSGLTSITIPNSVTSIGECAFYNCSGLTSITIPNSVTSIEYGAFSRCSNLTSVTIGSGIKTIGSEAFSRCRELTEVYCYAENVPSTKSSAFTYSPIENATLHVPTVSVDVYKAAEPWSGFKTIVGLDDSSKGDVNGDGKVDMNDVMEITAIILEKRDSSDRGDINGDGKVTVADVMKVVNSILG